MSRKLICKIIVDVLMLVAMPVLMAYMLVGDTFHEWLGTEILALFILHHILNFQWIKNIFHGKYTVSRIIKTVINILILCMIIGLAYSGIVLSRHVFADLDINASRAVARKMHMFCSYWGFVLMSLHFGFHWDMFLGIANKFAKNKSVLITVILRLLATGIAGYGLYAFKKHEIGSYMLMKIQFAFFDMEEPLFMFMLDYLAVMGLFSVVGYYIMYIIKLIKKKGRIIYES
ncbi:MAG: DUF4405 domain-containing protein [Lachnospiraceae bacterium]|nr:DUF4405 domain-containing protein [Lachnospiraceae bacterium]